MTNEQARLMFKVSPQDLGDELRTIRAGASARFESDRQLLANVTVDLGSVLPMWHLQEGEIHGDSALSNEQVEEQIQANLDTLKNAGAFDLAQWVQTEIAAIQSSNLTNLTYSTMGGYTNTWWGHDYATGLWNAMRRGAILVTTNPVLVDLARQEQPEIWTPVRGRLQDKYGTGDPVRLANAMTIEVVLQNARLLRPIWELTDGALGYVSLQLNPRNATSADAMIEEAVATHAQLEDALGDTPNTVFKVPGTSAGLEAARHLALQGMGVNVTVCYSVPQHLAFAEAIARASKAKVSFRTQMDGRLDDPVGEQLKMAGISDWEEVKKWASTAINQRLMSMLPSDQLEASHHLAASGRGPWNIQRNIQCGPIPNFITVFPDKAMEFDEGRRPMSAYGMWTELPDGYLDKLMKSNIFQQAYEPDGMVPEEFISFSPARATLDQFSDAYDGFLDWVCATS